MFTSELQYDLPPDRIAQSPSERRDHSRLLVYNRTKETVTHHHFHELPDLLPPSLQSYEMMFRSQGHALPGKRPTGGAVECLLTPCRSARYYLAMPAETWGKTAKAGNLVSMANTLPK